MMRVAEQNFECHSRRIAKGNRFFMRQRAANRDLRVFADPDWLDFRRADAAEHLTFGHAIRFCIGAPLVRLEG